MHFRITFSRIIASVTIETVLLYLQQFILYEVLAMDAILVKTWTLGQYDRYRIHSMTDIEYRVLMS